MAKELISQEKTMQFEEKSTNIEEKGTTKTQKQKTCLAGSERRNKGTLLKSTTDTPINDPRILSLVGYLIKANQQVHDFQYTLLREYVELKNIPDGEQIVRDVIFEVDTRTPYDTAIKVFNAENSFIQNEFLEFLYIIAGIDGTFEKEENQFFEELLKNVNSFENFDAIQHSGTKHAERLRKLLKKENAKYRSGKKSSSNDNLFRISQKEYTNTIKLCRHVAKEDLKLVSPICHNTIRASETLVSNLEQMISQQKKSSLQQDTASFLERYSSKIRESILSAAKLYRERLNFKEAAAEDFTIVLVGKTKAGKSTLKAVLTGSGKNEIGCGGQRTTLVNYVYEWNHLRIVDTPGIAAGADQEHTDKKIAEKALTSADVVLYLMPCDGESQDTRVFVDEIIHANKPLLFLLNYKKKMRLKKFLEDPQAWRSDTGSNSILGYAKPIQRMAEEKGYSEMIHIHAAYLLAALLADDEAYAEHASVLKNNSGINEFLASLKIAVVEQGTFLRSKTMLDDTICACVNWKKLLENALCEVKAFSDIMEESLPEKALREAQNSFLNNGEREIIQAYNTLKAEHARKFIDQKFVRKKDLSDDWKAYCHQIQFDDELKKALTTEADNFSKVVQNAIKDLTSDMNYELESSYDAIKNPLHLITFGDVLKGIGKIVPDIVLAIMSGGVTAIVSGVAAAVRFVLGLFKSKAAKERDEKEATLQKLYQSISEQADKAVATFKKDAKKHTDETIDTVCTAYNTALSCLHTVVEEGQQVCNQWEQDLLQLNMLFAERILLYLEPDHPQKILSINREYGSYFEIYVGEPTQADTSRLRSLLKDEVRIIVVDEA